MSETKPPKGNLEVTVSEAASVPRRVLLGAMVTAPLWVPACASKPQTPLAHLYGQDWVHGAYELYGRQYQGVQQGAEAQTKNAYVILARKGIGALDALQTREVPFFMRVDPAGEAFLIERTVPERLMFTAEMSEQDRDAATKNWERAREHIQTDYEEIRRLNGATNTLLAQLGRIRSAIDQGREEQFRLTRQVATLGEGNLPFELPFQVTSKDYGLVLTLLLDRLDDDCRRLAIVEASIVSVGLTARATDSGSGSLSANLYKVLYAVVKDASANEPRAALFPKGEADLGAATKSGRAIYERIRASPEYVAWEKRERTKGLEQLGALLTVLDSLTGLKTSAIYKQALDILRGDGDYLSYLKTAVRLLPGGDGLAQTLTAAIGTTERLRQVALGLRDKGKSPEALLKAMSGQALVNAGTQFALDRVDRQLSFFANKDEYKSVTAAIGKTSLLEGEPSLPELRGLLPEPPADAPKPSPAKPAGKPKKGRG